MARMLVGSIIVFFSIWALPASTVSAQDASASFAAGAEAYESGDYSRALAHFEAARDAGIEGPAVYYNIASCHFRLGEYEQAEYSFRLIADRYPAMSELAEYNLGLVAMRQHRDSDARQLFGAVQRDTDDAKLRVLADRALRRLEPSPVEGSSRVRWVGYVDMNIGRDDNVALIDDASLLPGQSVDSPFTELVGVVSGPLSPAPGFRFEGSFYSVRYDDAGRFDQNAARLRGAYYWQAGPWLADAGPHINYSTLDGDGFERRVGAGLRLRRSLNSTTALTLSLIHDEVDGLDAQYDFLLGSREQLGVTWDKHGAAGRLTLGYLMEFNDRDSATVSPTRNLVSLRHRYAMSPKWDTDMRIAFRSSRYDDLALTRKDNRTELSLGIVRHLAREWEVNATYRWFDNDSNVAPYSYTRNRTVLGVTRNF